MVAISVAISEGILIDDSGRSTHKDLYESMYVVEPSAEQKGGDN
jgi:hypothetical protein